MKHEERTEITKNRIIAAAIEEFGEKGYSDASLSSICDTGIPKGLLYHNYESRDAVYLACVKRCFDDFVEVLKKNEVKGDISVYMNTRLHFFQENPNKANLIIDTLLGRPVTLQAALVSTKVDFEQYNIQFFKSVLENIPRRPNLKDTDALSYFLVMQTAFNINYLNSVDKSLPVDKQIEEHEKQLQNMIDMVLYGIAKGDKE